MPCSESTIPAPTVGLNLSFKLNFDRHQKRSINTIINSAGPVNTFRFEENEIPSTSTSESWNNPSNSFFSFKLYLTIAVLSLPRLDKAYTILPLSKSKI